MTFYSKRSRDVVSWYLSTDVFSMLFTQMSDFIEGNFLHEQVEAIKEIGGYITNLKRVGPGHGEYHFDHETLGDS